MNGVAILLLAATLGVEYSWQTTPTGEVEYFVQMEPTILDSLAQNEVIHSDVPAEVGIVDRLVIRISGTKQTAAMVAARAARMPKFELPPVQRGTAPLAEIPSALYRPQTGIENIQSVSFGWQPSSTGEQEYYVQIEPTLLRTLADGDEIYIPLRIEAGKVARFVILSGTKELPRIAAKPKAGSLPTTTAGLPRTNLQVPSIDAPPLVNSPPASSRAPSSRMPLPPGSTDTSSTVASRPPILPPDDTTRARSPYSPSGYANDPAASPYSGTELASTQNYPVPPDSPTSGPRFTPSDAMPEISPPRSRTGDYAPGSSTAGGTRGSGASDLYPAPPVGDDTNLYPPLTGDDRTRGTQPGGYRNTTGPTYEDPRSIQPVGGQQPIGQQPTGQQNNGQMGNVQPNNGQVGNGQGNNGQYGMQPPMNGQMPVGGQQPMQPPIGQQPVGQQNNWQQQPGYGQVAAQMPPTGYQPVYTASVPPQIPPAIVPPTVTPTPTPAVAPVAESKAEPKPDLPYFPLFLTTLALMLSIGVNLYLGWTAAELYSRYRLAVERVRSVSR